VRGAGTNARRPDRVDPHRRRLAAGCHPNRDTVAAIEAAGLRIESLERFEAPGLLSGITPHVQGAATLLLAA
jgi:hypothetical protein